MKSEFLEVPKNMEFFREIGLFHIHDYQNKCFSWFAPNFIPGVGRIDDEIVETNWPSINSIAGSTRNMSKSHCQETIDLHMND